MILEKGEPRPLEEWETVVGDDFSLYYDAYSVDERVDSDSKVCWCAVLTSPFLICSSPLIRTLCICMCAYGSFISSS